MKEIRIRKKLHRGKFLRIKLVNKIYTIWKNDRCRNHQQKKKKRINYLTSLQMSFNFENAKQIELIWLLLRLNSALLKNLFRSDSDLLNKS